jgi:hypothetical protein
MSDLLLQGLDVFAAAFDHDDEVVCLCRLPGYAAWGCWCAGQRGGCERLVGIIRFMIGRLERSELFRQEQVVNIGSDVTSGAVAGPSAAYEPLVRSELARMDYAASSVRATVQAMGPFRLLTAGSGTRRGDCPRFG